MLAGAFADLVIAAEVTLAVVLGALVGVVWMLARIVTGTAASHGRHVRRD